MRLRSSHATRRLLRARRRAALAALGTLGAVLGLAGMPPARAEQADAAGLAVGSAMADFGLRKLDVASGKLGALVWLSDFVGGEPNAARKRLLVLNFFAAWCKPCVDELPVLAALQRKHAGHGLQVVSVYHRREGEALEDAIAQTRKQLATAVPPFPLLFDRFTNHNQRVYVGERGALPCNVLIAGDGRIAARFAGGRALTDGSLQAAVVELLELEP